MYPRAAVALLQVRPTGAVQILGRAGRSFDEPQARIEEEARAVALAASRRLAPGAGDTERDASGVRSAGRTALVPLRAAGGWVLAVEREASLHAGEGLEPLVLFCAIVGSAVEAARATASSRDAVARDEAMLAANRDGVLVVDRDGVVRAVNPAAVAALGHRREDLLGCRLRDLPGLAPLTLALASGAGDVGVVTLPKGDISVRALPYESGVIATIHPLAAEHAAARRSSSAPSARYTFEDLVGEAPAFQRVIEYARLAARSDMPVLVCGETGTGKELLAQAIHNASPRASEPFIGVNVTAIPRELPESELFGYEGGAFTGARAGGSAGKFELAGRGTLLLDEIGDMPLEMQAKLLRVLQEKVVQRVGSSRDIPVRARIIATSHRDLPEAVATGRFRLDLFHRLRVIHLHIPPLRERRGDVPLLVEHQLAVHAARTGRRVRISPRVLDLFEAYDWPGNVRELTNLVEGELGVLPLGENVLTRIPEMLLDAHGDTDGRPREDGLSLEELERRACEETLARYQGNVARAAAALGVAKGTLYAKIKRYGLEVARAARPTPVPSGGRSLGEV
jgi:transcriptional regulator with PAS, ATPase and Fis domain